MGSDVKKKIKKKNWSHGFSHDMSDRQLPTLLLKPNYISVKIFVANKTFLLLLL